jgi:hypothetical protein
MLKQFIAGRNRLEIEGSQALAKAFEVILLSFFLFHFEINFIFFN